MFEPISYTEKKFVIVNDLQRSTFYYFDFDQRSSKVNMEFEHFHPYYEILILLSPNAIHFLEGVPHPIQNYDFVLLPPRLLHKSCYPELDPSKRLVINFMYPDNGYGFPEDYECLLSPFYSPLPIYRFPEEQLTVLTGLINQIVDLSCDADSQELKGIHELTLHGIFTQFLYYLHRFQDSNLYEKVPVDDKVTERIYAVSNYIHSHYQENLTLETLAKESYMSPYYLSHQFKRITGYTVTHYIQLVRVRNCQFLLSNTAEKITDIALLCGFFSFSQFNRVFRRFCGESPSEYRRNHPVDQKSIREIPPLLTMQPFMD